jgi:hypothetical protein
MYVCRRAGRKEGGVSPVNGLSGIVEHDGISCPRGVAFVRFTGQIRRAEGYSCPGVDGSTVAGTTSRSNVRRRKCFFKKSPIFSRASQIPSNSHEFLRVPMNSIRLPQFSVPFVRTF